MAGSNHADVEQINLKGIDNKETVVEDLDGKINKKQHTGRCKKRRTVIVFLRKDNIDWHKPDLLSNLEHFELPPESLHEHDENDEEIYDEAQLDKPVYINFDISNFLQQDESSSEIEKKQRKLVKEKLRHSLKKKYCSCSCTKSYMFHYLNGSVATFPYEKDIRRTLENLYSRKETAAREIFEADPNRNAVEVITDDHVAEEEHKDVKLEDIEGLTEAELKLLSQKKQRKLIKKIKKHCQQKCERAGIASEWVHIYF